MLQRRLHLLTWIIRRTLIALIWRMKYFSHQCPSLLCLSVSGSVPALLSALLRCWLCFVLLVAVCWWLSVLSPVWGTQGWRSVPPASLQPSPGSGLALRTAHAAGSPGAPGQGAAAAHPGPPGERKQVCTLAAVQTHMRFEPLSFISSSNVPHCSLKEWKIFSHLRKFYKLYHGIYIYYSNAEKHTKFNIIYSSVLFTVFQNLFRHLKTSPPQREKHS